MKSGQQYQAEHTQRLKQVGLRQVAVWVSDTESWMVAKASAGAKADRLDTVDHYVAGLVDRSRQALIESFMGVDGKMALFETERDAQRKTIGVKVEDQRLDLQRARLKEAGCGKLFEEKISGAARPRPALERLLQEVRATTSWS